MIIMELKNGIIEETVSSKTDNFFQFCNYYKKSLKDNKTDDGHVTISDQDFVFLIMT